jgi:hypothetical protein
MCNGQEDFLLEMKESSRFPSWDQNKTKTVKAWSECKRMKTRENVRYSNEGIFKLDYHFGFKNPKMDIR